MRLGYCGGQAGWLGESDLNADTPDAVVDAVLVREGLDPLTADAAQRAEIRAVVEDWLFDPSGRGARSGLPR